MPPAVIVLGLSAGGLAPLRTVLEALPPRFPAALVIAMHVSQASDAVPLLGSWTQLEVAYASNGALVRPGKVYVCPAQRHLTINPDGTFTVSSKERVSFVRPSIDWLFEAAAATYEARATVVILSGANNDGTRGARRIRKNGGFVIAQDPATAEWKAMPRSAIRAGAVDACLPPHEIAAALLARVEQLGSAEQMAWLEPFHDMPMATVDQPA